MSSVDERIVEMRFENDQFEKGVSSSLKSLDKLKAGLNLDGAADSLSTLQTTANGFDISHISDGVDKITNRFSIFGIMADQAIRRVTNSLINLGATSANYVKSLTLDQIPVGFNKYERKVQSVQTIMNATGKDIGEVNGNLDKLNWYTDETSYSFTDMVDNIGKFTSSGVGLEEATTSMIGIANAAGYAGANVQDASHAMEGFSKAMGQGYMSRQNWQWIRTAHMDTVKFKEQMIEAAVEAKTLAKVMQRNPATKEMETFYYVANQAGKPIKNLAVSVEDFESNLAKGWLTKDVMNSALGEYGSFTEKIYEEYLQTGELTSEIIERLDDGTENLGLKAFKASQEAKTFSDAINSVKDAVSTGWMVSFEQIFGNYEEAKKLWTAVANELWEVFNGGAEHRNEILKEWHDNGGYQMLLTSIRNIWETTKAIGEAVRGVFEEFFPPLTTKRLMDFSRKFVNLTKSFRDLFVVNDLKEFSDTLEDIFLKDISKQNEKASKNIDKLKNAFTGLFSIVKLGKFAFSSFLKILSPFSRLFKAAGKSVFEFTGSFGKYVTNLVDAIINSKKFNKVIDTLTDYTDKLVSIILNTVKGIKDFTKALKNSEAYKKFIDFIKQTYKSIKEKFSPYIENARKKIKEFFKNFTGLDQDDISALISTIVSWFEKFSDKISDVYSKVKRFLTPAMEVLRSIYSRIYPYIKKVTDKIETFWNSMIAGKKIGPYISDILGKFKTKFDELCTAASEFIKNFNFKGFWQGIKNFFAPVTQKIDDWIDNIKLNIESLDLGKLAAAGVSLSIIPTIISIGVAFAEAAKLLKTSKGLVTNLNDLINKFKFGFKSKLVETAKAVAVFASAIAILAGAFKLISTVPADRVKESLNIIIWFAGILTVMTTLVAILSKLKMLDSIKTVGFALIEISAAVTILAGALVLLDRANPKASWKQIGILVTMATLLMTIMGLLGKYVPGFTKGSFAMVSFAASILIIAEAFKRVSEVDEKRLASSLELIGTLMAIMGLISSLGGAVKFGAGLGTLGMVGSIFLLLKLFEKLSDDSIKTITEKAQDNLYFIGGVIAGFGLLSLAARIGGKHAGKTGFAILAMASATLIVYQAIKKLGELDDKVLIKGGSIVAGILGFFALLSASTWKASANSQKAGIAVLAMTSSLLIVYLAIKKFGQMNPNVLTKGLLGVIPLLVVFASMTKALGKLRGVRGITGSLIGMAIVIGTIAAALSFLTLYSFSQLATSVGSLAAVIGSLGLLMLGISKIKIEKSAIIGLIGGLAAIGAIAWAISSIANYNWQNLAGAAGSIAGCLLALSAAMRIVSAGNFSHIGFNEFGALVVGLGAMYIIGAILSEIASKNTSGMIDAALSISAVLLAVVTAASIMATVGSALGKADPGSVAIGIGELTIAMAAIAALFLATSWIVGNLEDPHSIEKGAEIIGNAIGAFVGGIFGEGMATAARKLEEVGTSLTKFMENASGFIEGISNLPPNIGSDLFNLTRALQNFSKMGKEINKGKDIGLDTIATQLSSLSAGLKQFGEDTAGIKLENIELAAKAGDLLNELLVKLEPTGGLMQKIFGSSSWDSLSDGLAEFGDALAKLSTYDSKQIVISNIKNAIRGGELLTELLEKVPESGGLLQKFTGEASWGVLSNGLANFGDALANLSKHDATSINIPNIQNAIRGGELLKDLLEKVPEAGGLKQKFAGEVTWDTISVGLEQFGNAMVTFNNTVSGKFGEDFASSVASIGGVVDLFDKLSGTFGNGYLSNAVTMGILNLASALKKFDSRSGKLKVENMSNAQEYLRGIRVMVEDFTETGTEMGSALTAALETALNPETANGIGSSFIQSLLSSLVVPEDTNIDSEKISTIASIVASTLYDSIKLASSFRGIAAGIDMINYLSSGVTAEEVLKKLSEAGQSAGNTFITAFETTIGSNLSPVITPVVDMTALENCKNTIDTYLSGNIPVSAQSNLMYNNSNKQVDYSGSLRQLITLNQNLLAAVRAGGDVYLDGNIITGYVNAHMGKLNS